MTLDADKTAALLKSVTRTGLLVIGDFMLDRTISGEANRISPEAPSLVVLAKETRHQLGGAGNVVRNVESLGGKIWCAAVVGDDEAGDMLSQQLRSLSCQDVRIVREPGRKTTLKTRVVAVQGRESGATGWQRQIVRIDEESRSPISESTASAILQFAADVIRDIDGVILSDYAKGALPPAFVGQLIELARSAQKPVFVDPKTKNFHQYERASVLTPNAAEFESALGISLAASEMGPPAAWEENARAHVRNLGLDALLITRGADGVSLIDHHGFHHFPTNAREVFDVTGAGDTLIAAFSLAAASGAGYPDAAQFGNLAAGVAVGKAGTAVVYPFEVQRELAVRRVSAETKIRTRQEIAAVAEQLRQEKKKIVFTNGCFDLLHAGHIHLLREAKKLGDIIVVGLNSDESIRTLKGSSRPIVPEDDRAYAIASLECIDYVVVFNELDPMNLLKAIRPDVLVKGGDYAAAEVVGNDFVTSYGGVTELIPLREGISTTRLVEKIRSSHGGPAGNS